MAFIRYEGKKFREDALDIIEAANVIIAEYAQEGYDLTLRQLYYRFIARAFFPNTERSYKRLGSIVNDARLAGLIDWERLVDRTRKTEIPNAWDDPAKIIEESAKIFALDLWKDQPNYVETWVEKQALDAVAERASKELNIPYFSCKGYVSQSEMWKSSRRLLGKVREGKKVVILHLGDHDPSGIDMTRDIRERLEKFIGMDYCRFVAKDRKEDPAEMKDVRSVFLEAMNHLEIRRIALTMDQIEEHTPPPNPAKISDSRYEKYLHEYGHESWELDALPPPVLVGLIREHTEELRDEELWDAAVEEQAAQKADLDETADRWEDVVDFLRA